MGDDAAILRPQNGFDWHISTDMLITERHFFSDIAPDDLAYKILAVNISDMAAMGAKPKYILLSAAMPKLDKKWLDLFFASLHKVLNDYQIKLIDKRHWYIYRMYKLMLDKCQMLLKQ